MASATETSRSPFREVLNWALPELAGYVLAALGAVFVFTVWAVIYTYVWPGKPAATSIEIPAPPPVSVPASPAPTPPIVVPDPAPAVAQVPGDRIPEGLPIAPYVYNVNSDKVGKIAAVLLGNDRKVDVYILAVGDWFLDGSEKVIAVPSQKMTWVKEQNYGTKQYEWTAVVSMTKADVQNAPKQIFDFDAKKWVPAQ
jgi:hypothetical protein